MVRECKINDEVVTISPSWNVVKNINKRSTANFTITNLNDLSDIVVGNPVTFKEDSTFLFSGIVNRCKMVDDMAQGITYHISCVDNNSIAGRLLIAENGSNEDASDVVRDKILPVLEDDGVTEGNIQEGLTLSNYTFNNIYVDAALDKLKDITGYNWNIDDEKKLNFFSNSFVEAPFSLEEDTRVLNFTKESSLAQYRNVQYLKAGKGKTDLQEDITPTPEPDGVSRTFVLDYNIASKPQIFINSVEVSESDIGVRGVEPDKKWYFKYGENTISQDDSETVLTSSDLLEVTYTGLFDILTVAENETQIVERRTVEGGSGRYESIVQEESLTEADEALEYSEGLLNKYGELADVVTFTTYTTGLEAGQILNITKSKYNIDGEFFIDSITMKRYSADKIEYKISCIDGASLGGWEEFFKRMVRSQKDFIVNENETLIKLKKLKKEEFSVSDSVVISSGSPESRIGYMKIDTSEVD